MIIVKENLSKLIPVVLQILVNVQILQKRRSFMYSSQFCARILHLDYMDNLLISEVGGFTLPLLA